MEWGWLTRIQQELLSSSAPSRSQWNWSFTRPYLSQWISSPAGPVTRAVWGPRTWGLGVRRPGRKGWSAGTASTSSQASSWPASPSGPAASSASSRTWKDTAVTKKDPLLLGWSVISTSRPGWSWSALVKKRMERRPERRSSRRVRASRFSSAGATARAGYSNHSPWPSVPFASARRAEEGRSKS